METVARVAFVYVFLFVALRIMGKREFGQLAPFDLVVLLIIPELFQQAMIGGDDRSMTTAVVGVGTLLTLVFATSVLAYRSDRARAVLESSPTVLVHDGSPLVRHLDRERVSAEEVLEAVRHAGLDRIEDVRWAILESSGKISVVPRAAVGREVELRAS